MKTSSGQILSAVCDEIATVLGSGGADLAGALSRIGPLLEWVLLNERDEAQPDTVVSLRVPAHKEAPAVHLTAEQVRAYLRERFRDEDARVSSVRQIVGGFSRRTTRVSCAYQGADHDLVFRQAVEPRRDAVLEAEFTVLSHAWRQGVEAPVPAWIEPEPNLLGGPFFVTQGARGSNPGDVFGASGTVPAAVGEDLARFLARLHALDASGPERFPVAPMGTREQIEALVTAAGSNLRAAQGALPGAASRLFDWLFAHLPDPCAPPVIVHGDVGFHNLLADDGRLTVVLDWERAHAGAAAEDLAYVRPTLAGVIDWRDFLACYQAAGGTVPDAETLQFYTVWQDVWRYVACESHLAAYERIPRLSSLFAGRIFGPRFLRDALGNAGL